MSETMLAAMQRYAAELAEYERAQMIGGITQRLETAAMPQRSAPPERALMIAPTVGRIVYYASYGSTGEEPPDPWAALITRVHTHTCVDLAVFSPHALVFVLSVVHGAELGQWDWPPFQKAQAPQPAPAQPEA